MEDFEKKASGNLTSIKVSDGVFAIYQKRYDINSGEEVDPKVQTLTFKNLQEIKGQLTAQLADVQATIDDLKTL